MEKTPTILTDRDGVALMRNDRRRRGEHCVLIYTQTSPIGTVISTLEIGKWTGLDCLCSEKLCLADRGV